MKTQQEVHILKLPGKDFKITGLNTSKKLNDKNFCGKIDAMQNRMRTLQIQLKLGTKEIGLKLDL